jgi:hypothetical protein
MFFCPEDGNKKFLRKLGTCVTNYTATQPFLHMSEICFFFYSFKEKTT